ncbi:MAG: TIGR02452 family protein [Bacteroidaceae bacterium]|nr:TIGR02452 family protein [Bacteroidaceae bacterium]
MSFFDYRQINFEVMNDTKRCYEMMSTLQEAIKQSIATQYMVTHEDSIDQPIVQNSNTRYFVSGMRTFEAARKYKGKKTAVLNYANNHSIGGSPFFAGAQEESLCRCSTLLPCLQAMEQTFYQKHINLYSIGVMDDMGNDDLIYTPDVVVFKTDERTDPIYPRMMAQEDWYKVNIITCAAPQMNRMFHFPTNYDAIIRSRIKKILDIATKEGNEVIILGNWGCGAFRNSIDVVSREFVSLLQNYEFETVEFALATKGDVSQSAFARQLTANAKAFSVLI